MTVALTPLMRASLSKQTEEGDPIFMCTKRMYICVFGLIMTLSFLFEGCRGGSGSGSQLKENFLDNGKNEPYAAETPLSEMDFSIYTSQYYSDIIQPLMDPDYNKRVTLPCDVEYYRSPGDATPILTLPKGSDVYVLPRDAAMFPTIGYGLQCWPDYQEGWRYGQPFVADDFSRNLISEKYDKYYVRTEQIASVAKEFYRINRKALQNLTAAEFEKQIVLEIDQTLYDNGAFCSPDLAELVG